VKVRRSRPDDRKQQWLAKAFGKPYLHTGGPNKIIMPGPQRVSTMEFFFAAGAGRDYYRLSMKTGISNRRGQFKPRGMMGEWVGGRG